MISQPSPPAVPVTTLADRIKTWPILAVHRFEHIEAELLAFEARLVALEPKKAAKPDYTAQSYAQSGAFAGKSIFAPPPPTMSPPPTIFAPAKT